jgi:hypothetical protein
MKNLLGYLNIQVFFSNFAIFWVYLTEYQKNGPTCLSIFIKFQSQISLVLLITLVILP